MPDTAQPAIVAAQRERRTMLAGLASIRSRFDAGLSLAPQIATRPVDAATALRIGHAYEQATP